MKIPFDKNCNIENKKCENGKKNGFEGSFLMKWKRIRRPIKLLAEIKISFGLKKINFKI
jgi:hypothetical protein